ncbi:type II secretion system GspH family protein [Patescibacteria group bacterium]|nr:type II secretion system GspH family protein [Patescibacteria group bacterium]MBU4162303.1 type II secretion system GspH family protein [Patescibacteria group bacterium]
MKKIKKKLSNKGLTPRFFSYNQNGGFTLIEVLVATLLISIIFLGIFGGFQLAVRVVAQSKARMQAVYLASEKIEEMRGLNFVDIETTQESIVVNGVEYNTETIVEDFDDCADGTIEGFDCSGAIVLPDTAPDDYKKIKVRVSWQTFFGGEMVLSSYAASESLETGEGKGAMRVSLSDSLGQPIEILTGDQLAPCSASSINIINNGYGLDQCYGTDTNNPGVRVLILDESLEPDDYKIIVSKSGYAAAETFRSGDTYGGTIISTPNRKNPTINEGELYPITFIIDLLSDLNISTALAWSGDSFFDTFLNQNKISTIENLIVSNGQATLATSSPISYFDSGYLESTPIVPGEITEWYDFEWSELEDTDTDITYQVFYATSSSWLLVPDIDIPGNSSGLEMSPVDLSQMDINKYSELKIGANFSTSDVLKTPTLYEWRASWKNGEETIISNVSFDIRGDKTVGTDIEEYLIYKYSETLTSDSGGHKLISGLETDNYYFSGFIKNGSALNLNSSLSPMPFNLLSGTSTGFTLYLESDNSLLVKVKDVSIAEPVFGAGVRLSNQGLGYDVSLTTNESGEALFLPLQISANYVLEIQAQNYYEETIPIAVSGNNYKEVGIERYE